MSDQIDVDEHVAEIRRRRAEKNGGNGGDRTGNGQDGGPKIKWAQPKPLPSGLAPVEPFNSEFLPDALASWVDDIANRLQCPSDYVGITAMTSIGAVIGRRIGIKLQAKTDWTEVPNVWGAFIGRPGMLKSPAMTEALKPIHRLESEAAKEHEVALQAYANGLDIFKLRKKVNESLVKEKLKADTNAEIDIDFGEEPGYLVPTCSLAGLAGFSDEDDEEVQGVAGGADHAVRAGADHVAKGGEQLQENGLGLGLGVRSQGAHGFSGEAIERVFVEYRS